MKYFILAIAFWALTARADQETNAINSQIGDVVSTAAALSQGATELNPLGPANALILKPVLYAFIKSQPKEDQSKLFSIWATIGWGATGNNLCVLVGGGLGCLLVGLISGIVSWESGSLEREYWEMCKRVKHKDPNDHC